MHFLWTVLPLSELKLSQPKEALDYMLKAVALSDEPDATLFDHLGDIYAALNQPDKAREAWTKSLAVEPNEQVRKNSRGASQMKFMTHYTREEARALLPDIPQMAQKTGSPPQ